VCREGCSYGSLAQAPHMPACGPPHIHTLCCAPDTRRRPGRNCSFCSMARGSRHRPVPCECATSPRGAGQSVVRTHARTHALRLTSRRGSTIAGNGGTEGSGLPLVFRVGSHLVLRCWPRNPGHGVRCPQGEHDAHFRATKFVPKQQTRAGARGARPSDHCENSGGMSQRELSEPKANDGPSTVRESKYGEKFSINCALTPADTPRCCACSHARAHASRP